MNFLLLAALFAALLVAGWAVWRWVAAFVWADRLDDKPKLPPGHTIEPGTTEYLPAGKRRPSPLRPELPSEKDERP